MRLAQRFGYSVERRFDYSGERQRHEQLVGRAELLARLDQLLVNGDGDRWVVVTGGPGMGKSAILAAWLARREAAGATVPHHFIRRGQYDWDDPAQLVGSLVAQLEDRFAALREPEADARMHPAARLARMLSRVSEHVLVPRRERLVVLVDGLDEYDPPAKAAPGDPLTAFLPHALPAGVSVLCASRPRHPYVASLAARDGGFVQIDLDDPASAADNEATVRAFWERAAGPLGLDPRDREDARFLDEAVARASGNVQHAVQLHKQLDTLGPEQRRAARHRIDDIPRGLEALIAQAWEHIAVDPIVVQGLGILCVAREALSLDELGAVVGWAGDVQRRAFVRGAMELLVETRRPDGTREYRLHHDSIRAHIAQQIGLAALSEHHRSVAQRLASWPCAPNTSSRRYALRHAVIHRAEAGDRADAWQLAADVSFLEARCRELGVDEAEADVIRLAVRCRASGDEALGQHADDLARALARESHWLRADPEATAALVWNRLRRSGWSTSDLDAQLHVPEGTDFLRVRHAATRETPALVRNLEGDTGYVTACAVTPDGRHVVSASNDHTLKVWDLATGRALATLAGHTDGVRACAVTPDGRHVVSASDDQTLKVWELATGRALATLAGHTDWVRACAVTPDGRHAVSASDDQTLKVWELETHACLVTHRGDASYRAIVATSTVIIAGDDGGVVWFLDVPSSHRSTPAPDVCEGKPGKLASHPTTSSRSRMNKHTILFLAAHPLGTDPRALDREARAIQVELECSGHRDRFELVTRWAVEPLDLLRELRKLKPTVVHFSGHGAQHPPSDQRPTQARRRDVAGDTGHRGDEPRDGLYFQGPDGRAQLVSVQALQEAFGAAGASVQLVVLSACYSATQADALRAHVDCIVGMRSGLDDAAARAFAIGFYGGLGERASVAAAYRHGCAAISLEGLSDADRPQLAVRDGIDAEKLVLAGEAPMTRDDLLTRLSQLLPSQFEEVLFRAKIPAAHLPGASAPQATRAIDAIRYLEQHHQLEQLAQILEAVATGPS